MGNRKVGFWRSVGSVLNTRAGARVMESAGGLVNRAAGLAAPDLTGEIPWCASRRPIAESRLAVISTAGFYLEGDRPFDVDALEGDTSFRVLPSNLDPAALRIAHAHYPHRWVNEDINVLLPIDHLRRLEEAGVVRLAPRFFSFGYGGQQVRGYVAPQTGTAHQVARLLREDEVDLALLVPA